MISAFITAISQFRTEFEIGDEERLYEVLPMSDIIRVVPTMDFVCAFITLSSASIEQEERMIEFARGAGRLLEETVETYHTQVNDVESIQLLERFFDEVMDGFLLKDYKRGVARKFPRRFRCLESTMEVTGTSYFVRPTYLIKNMSKQCSISEADSALLVLEAIENELLALCEEEDFSRTDWDDDWKKKLSSAGK
jgi:hypothetical protein